jgi:hypothetical protein
MAPRGGMMTRVNDPFRSRIPNTSRPPSMHVDDFILAQHNIGQSTGGPDGSDANRTSMMGKVIIF